MTQEFGVEALKQIMLGKGMLYDMAIMNRALAKHYCPVKKGPLRDSINYLIDEDKMVITVGSDLSYSEYVEKGTRQMERAHGKHDPKNPVTDWEAKRKTGKNIYAQMPFLKPAAFETQQNMEYFIPKKTKMKVKLIVR